MIRTLVATAALTSATAFAQEVYKCGNTYSDSPCSGAKIVNAQPAVSNPSGPKTKLIYLCKRPDKNQPWWIHEECSRRGWTVIESVRVPNNIHWDDQVQIAERKRAENRHRPRPTHNYNTPSTTDNTSSQCEALDRRAAHLDSMGRAGGTARRMEWIRSERQKARDRQFQLRC